MRAISRTTLTLGDLLEVPVGVAGATGSTEIKLDSAWPDGAKREQLYVHPEDRQMLNDENGEAVSAFVVPDDRQTVKGVRVGHDLRRIPDSEVEWAKEVAKLDAVEVLDAIDFRKVPTDRLVGSYWLQPDAGFAKPLMTLAEALRRRRLALLVKFNLRSRQKLGVIRPRSIGTDTALLVNGLVFAADWREPDGEVLLPKGVVEERAIEAAARLLDDFDGSGDAIESATDELMPLMEGLVEQAHEGAYDSVEAVEELAQSVEADWPERAAKLRAYASERWAPVEDAADAAEPRAATPAA